MEEACGMWMALKGEAVPLNSKPLNQVKREGKVPTYSPGANAGWLDFLGDLRQ